jgi:hypothetical protein
MIDGCIISLETMTNYKVPGSAAGCCVVFS